MRNYNWCSNINDPLLQCDISYYVNESLNSLLRCDFTGYDPGSYYAPQVLKLKSQKKGLPARIQNKCLHTMISWGGIKLIKVLSLPEVRSTKAIALTAMSLFHMRKNFDTTKIVDNKAVELLGELKKNRSPYFKGWSPDFNYTINGSSITRLKIGTINTVFCAEAFWLWRNEYKEALDILYETAQEMMQQLPRYENKGLLCFSYNPSTEYFVHNANLFIALLLSRLRSVGYSFKDNFIPEKCVKFILEDFKKNNIIRYAASPTPNNTIDNYHTGFVLRTLSEIKLYLNDNKLIKQVDELITHGVAMYVNTFITNKYIRKFYQQQFKVQAHSVAESILMYKVFCKDYPNNFDENYKRAVQRSFFALWNERENQFDSEVAVLCGKIFWRNISPMPRWAWAWMLLSLCA